MPINLSSKNPKIARSCSVTTIECRTQSDSWDVQSWHEVALAGEGPRSCSGLLVDLTLQKKGYKVLQASKHCTHNTKVSIRSRSPQTKSCLNVLTLRREMCQTKARALLWLSQLLEHWWRLGSQRATSIKENLLARKGITLISMY